MYCWNPIHTWSSIPSIHIHFLHKTRMVFPCSAGIDLLVKSWESPHGSPEAQGRFCLWSSWASRSLNEPSFWGDLDGVIPMVSGTGPFFRLKLCCDMNNFYPFLRDLKNGSFRTRHIRNVWFCLKMLCSKICILSKLPNRHSISLRGRVALHSKVIGLSHRQVGNCQDKKNIGWRKRFVGIIV